MKHASPQTLDALAPLLKRVRAIPGLTERKAGIFYLRANAFLHFHEDPAVLFADLKLPNSTGFTRFPVNQSDEQDELVAAAIGVASAVNSLKRSKK